MAYQLKMGPATRDSYGQALVEVGRRNPNVVVLDADLTKSTKTAGFQKAFPDRHFNLGIAEANMVGVAAGLASCGKIPFASSFACFLMSKGFDQLRIGVAYSQLNVKIVVTHGGISIGEDGVSQMSHEDIGQACLLPGFTVVVPCDDVETRAAICAIAEHVGPCFVRTGRPKAPIVYPDEARCPFRLGQAIQLRDGRDVTLVANGLLVAQALLAADELAGQGISARVLDMHTVKPLDEEALARAARDTGRIVVAEEHLLYGGLGSACAMAVAKHCPVPMRFIGLNDTYAESGSTEALMEKYGLTAACIVRAARELVRA